MGNSVTDIGALAFSECSSLTSINIPDSVTSIASSAFYSCSSLETITIPDSVTEIESSAFRSCSNLKTVSIGNNVTRLGSHVFYDCSSLENITMGESIIRIEPSTFVGCSNLTRIIIPESVTHLGNYAFYGCSGLEEVYSKGDAPIPGSDVFTKADQVTVFYLPQNTGWGEVYGGRPTQIWEPKILTDDEHFGIKNDDHGIPNFGFFILGPPGLLIEVEASDSLSNPIWSQLDTITLTDGSAYFTDSDGINFPNRFYRLRTP